MTGDLPMAPDRLQGPDGPLFSHPWQAQAFAMTLALHERGLFSWREWADALAGQIATAQAGGDPDTGENYYCHWLAALEGLVPRTVAGSSDELDTYRQAWSRAAERTPHGQPMALRDEDFAA